MPKIKNPTTVMMQIGQMMVEPKEVNFFDCYQNLRYSYTIEEAQNLTEMPPLPDHSDAEIALTSQGWNFTLEEINALETPCNIGEYVYPSDGSTVFKFVVPDGDADHRTGGVGVWYNTVTINWGDGSPEESHNYGVYYHEFAEPGTYFVRIRATGDYQLRHSSYNCVGGITGGNSFRADPHNVMFRGCYIGKTCTLIGFLATYYLDFVTIPKTDVYMDNLRVLFAKFCMGSLHGLYGVSSGDARYPSLANSITEIAANVFNGAYSNFTFHIPESLEKLGGSNFMFLVAGKHNGKITFPATLTEIGTNGLSANDGMYMSELKFKSAVPPTISSANEFNTLPTTCKILVPTGSLEAYKTATNYPDPTIYTYEEF